MDATSTLASRFTKQPNQPRAFVCFPRFIQTYVKENTVITFEEAVRKMTSLPANIMNIKDRGLIAVELFMSVGHIYVIVYKDLQILFKL